MLNTVKTIKVKLFKQFYFTFNNSVLLLIICRRISRNIFLKETSTMEENELLVYGILKEPLFRKHIKSSRIDPNISKYGKFRF